jgi:hypothetical protein
MSKKTEPVYTERQFKLREQLSKKDWNTFTYAITPSAIPHLKMMEVFHPEFPVPLCIVWFRFVGEKTIEIMDSKTHYTFRRIGLRTIAHQKMVEGFSNIEIIWSETGTPEGLSWMKKMGYKQGALGWEFRITDRQPK